MEGDISTRPMRDWTVVILFDGGASQTFGDSRRGQEAAGTAAEAGPGPIYGGWRGILIMTILFFKCRKAFCLFIFIQLTPVVSSLLETAKGYKVTLTLGRPEHVTERGLLTAFELIHYFLSSEIGL